jgi:hypothetical protein
MRLVNQAGKQLEKQMLLLHLPDRSQLKKMFILHFLPDIA